MKYIVLTLSLLFTCVLYSQSGVKAVHSREIKDAIFQECKDADNPIECIDEKFKRDIEGLVSNEITAAIRASADSTYYTVSFAFLSDGKGKVVPETVKIVCNNALLNTKIANYITTLPPFYPKENDTIEPRSVHFEDYTFVYNNEQKRYYIASPDELKALGITPEYVRIITQPTLQECSNSPDSYKCTEQKWYRIVQNTYRLPEIETSGVIKLNGTFIIEKNGTLAIHEITCNTEDEELIAALIEEYRRVLNTFPRCIPGHYLGVPVRTMYTLPLALRIAD